MSLYNEFDPPFEGEKPMFPPLLKGHSLGKTDDLISKVIAKASLGSIAEVFYNDSEDYLNFAITLAPEVNLLKASQMHHALMIAIGDSIGSLAPPEVAVTYKFPGFLLLNKGISGFVRLSYDPSNSEKKTSNPDWLIVEANLRLKANFDKMPIEFRMKNTSFLEEGAGFISKTRLIESICKHFLVWINKWEGEGFKPLHNIWSLRHGKEEDYYSIDQEEIYWIGLDENGSGLFKIKNKPETILITDADKYFETSFEL